MALYCLNPHGAPSVEALTYCHDGTGTPYWIVSILRRGQWHPISGTFSTEAEALTAALASEEIA